MDPCDAGPRGWYRTLLSQADVAELGWAAASPCCDKNRMAWAEFGLQPLE
jgi:hypothetical protein